MASNILVSSSGNKVPLIKAVLIARNKVNPESRVFAGDSSKSGLARHFAEDFWLMPRIPGAELEEILNGCVNRNIKIIIPTRDAELWFWSKHKNALLKHGIFVCVSERSAVDVCLNKLEFSRFGGDNKLPLIPSYLDPASCKSKKIVVKENFGSGSKGILVGCDVEEGLAFGHNLKAPIYQPFIPGVEISADVYAAKDGDTVLVSTRTRDLVINGESKITSVFIDSDLNFILINLVKILGLSGPAVIQGILKDDVLHIIECNPRIGGASTAAIAAGLPLLELSLMEALGIPIEDRINRIQITPIRQLRVEQDLLDIDINI